VKDHLPQVVLHLARKIQVANDRVLPGNPKDDVLAPRSLSFHELIDLTAHLGAVPGLEIPHARKAREYCSREVAPQACQEQVISSDLDTDACFQIDHRTPSEFR